MQSLLCPVCSGPAIPKMTMPVDAKTFEATDHGHIHQCSACHFGFIYPPPSDTSAFYVLDRYYTQGASHMVAMRETSFLTRLRNHLAWRFDKGEVLADVIAGSVPISGTIVDIGCGGGNLLRHLSHHGYQMTGIERDTTSTALRELHVLEGSAEALPPLPAHSFDGVVFSHVVEHLVEPLPALRSAAALLKPGGKLFCEVPNNESLIARQSGLSWEHLDVPRHVNFFNERSLKNLVEQAGLKVDRTYFSGFCRYFSDTYIATEQKIHDRLVAIGAADSIRNSTARTWRLLARTAFAPPRQKYDSVGLVATLR